MKAIAGVLLVVAALVPTLAAAQPSNAAATAPAVLFICPHGAAKSVMASAYFLKLAKERGLNVRVDAAGTEPEPQLSKNVVAHLTKNGYAIPIEKPRAATVADMASSDIIVSMGSDLSKLPASKGTLKSWTVPDFSANFDAAEQSIRAQVAALVDELVARQKIK